MPLHLRTSSLPHYSSLYNQKFQLEAKLKEVKDKKKKKKALEKSDLKLDSGLKLCDALSMDKELVMKANGISNVGVVNLVMNHGTSGENKQTLFHP